MIAGRIGQDEAVFVTDSSVEIFGAGDAPEGGAGDDPEGMVTDDVIVLRHRLPVHVMVGAEDRLGDSGDQNGPRQQVVRNRLQTSLRLTDNGHRVSTDRN